LLHRRVGDLLDYVLDPGLRPQRLLMPSSPAARTLWRNRVTDPRSAEAIDAVVPLAPRAAVFVADTMAAIAVVLLVATRTAIGIWAWHLTPLTARSRAGWFAFGVVRIVLFRETWWSGAGSSSRRCPAACVAFLRRAVRWSRERGTPSRACSAPTATSHAWAAATCTELGIARHYTRPRRPQISGKAKALVKTLLPNEPDASPPEKRPPRTGAPRLSPLVQPPPTRTARSAAGRPSAASQALVTAWASE
jgi:hypothetical protein